MLQFYFLLIFLSLNLSVVNGSCDKYKDCKSCAGAENGACKFCLTTSKCLNLIGLSCRKENVIKDSFDCPVNVPTTEFAYDDKFARYTAFPLIAAAFNPNPQICFDNQKNNYKLVEYREVICDSTKHNDTCASFVAFDNLTNTISVGFRGTSGNWELVEEILSILKGKNDFEGGGKVYSYFYNAFYNLFNNSISQGLTKAKQMCPNCDNLIGGHRHRMPPPRYRLACLTGHSLGGSLASIFGTLAIHRKLFDATKVKTITLGQPRTGDEGYAKAHDALHKYSYRVVHRKDPVPHLPPKLGSDPVFHHRYEIWYNNAMGTFDDYSLCLRADDDSCSNSQIDLQFSDHTHYFWMMPLSEWGNWGCNSTLPH